jgi:hypothetical protein
MNMGSRYWRRMGGALVALVSIGSTLAAQDTAAHRIPDTSSSHAAAAAEQEYLTKRQAELNDIRSAERKLAELRSERIKLESRVESVAAKASEARASQLLLSHETTALRSLDSVLTASQDNLLAQRDRFLSLGEAVRRRAAAELVVVIRVDSSAQVQRIDNISVQVDSAPAVVRHYTAGAVDALNAGAVDEAYHSNVLPATHTISATAVVNGASLTKAANVDVPTAAITYVQFAVRNGQLVLSTWSNRSGTSP